MVLEDNVHTSKIVRELSPQRVYSKVILLLLSLVN
jgi:hypothetical protein